MRAVGHVAELWRYPVKSMGGERLSALHCSSRGVDADRQWAVLGADGKIGSGKTTRRFRRMPGLLSLSASIDPDGVAWIAFSTGERLRADDPASAMRVGEVVGEPVTLEREGAVSYLDDAPVHLVSASSLSWLGALRPDDAIDSRRLRPNVVIDTDGQSTRPEDAWLGRVVEIGTAQVRVEKQTVRCVMVTMSQPGLGFAPGVLRDLEARSDASIGVYASCVAAGEIQVGDKASILG